MDAVQASQRHGARDPVERLSRLATGVDVDLPDVGLRFAELRERRVGDVQLLAEEPSNRVERVGGQLAGPGPAKAPGRRRRSTKAGARSSMRFPAAVRL
jgi:hypothetical protein